MPKQQPSQTALRQERGEGGLTRKVAWMAYSVPNLSGRLELTATHGVGVLVATHTAPGKRMEHCREGNTYKWLICKISHHGGSPRVDVAMIQVSQ